MQAKYVLGTWLCEGRGNDRGEDHPSSTVASAEDFDRGVALQLEAAAAGHARATYNIGVFYLQGTGAGAGSGGEEAEGRGGVRRDLVAAAVWFQKASALGKPSGVRPPYLLR